MWDRSGEDGRNDDKSHQNKAICLHTFSDLSYTAPPVFIYLLKEGYVYGNASLLSFCSIIDVFLYSKWRSLLTFVGTLKATPKFKILQQQVSLAFLNSATVRLDVFVVQCLYLLPFCGPTYTEGFSHLLLSCLCRVQAKLKMPDITPEARSLAARLFVYDLSGNRVHEDRILVKLLQIFNVGFEDIANVMLDQSANVDGFDIAKSCIEQYIFTLIDKQSYMMAVNLLQHFSMRQFEEPFLYKMIDDNQFIAAEKWAAFMGRPMLHLLVQKYLEMKMVKAAYGVIKANNLKEEFPNVHRLYKETYFSMLYQNDKC